MPKKKYHYVYALIDPRTCAPFYIGKGTGDRKNQHFNTIPTALKGAPTSAKYKMIEEIKAEGLVPTATVLSHHPSDAEALKAEKTMIKQIGLENLTNENLGGGGDKSTGDHVIADRKPTVNQERFCLALKDPDCPSELAAYRIGYPRTTMSDSAASSEAWKLKQNPVIIRRLAELDKELVAYVGATVEECSGIFRRAASLAEEIAQPSSMTGAAKELGTLAGLYPNQPQVVNNVQNLTVKMSKLELARRVAGILQTGTSDG